MFFRHNSRHLVVPQDVNAARTAQISTMKPDTSRRDGAVVASASTDGTSGAFEDSKDAELGRQKAEAAAVATQ